MSRGFAPAGATKGLSDRPLETFGARWVGHRFWKRGRRVTFPVTLPNTLQKTCGAKESRGRPQSPLVRPQAHTPLPKRFGLRPTKGLSDRPLETFGAHLVGQRFFVPGQESYFRLLLCPAPYKRHAVRRGPGGDRKAPWCARRRIPLFRGISRLRARPKGRRPAPPVADEAGFCPVSNRVIEDDDNCELYFRSPFGNLRGPSRQA